VVRGLIERDVAARRFAHNQKHSFEQARRHHANEELSYYLRCHFRMNFRHTSSDYQDTSHFSRMSLIAPK
jgi:hypothetical protein